MRASLPGLCSVSDSRILAVEAAVTIATGGGSAPPRQSFSRCATHLAAITGGTQEQ